MGRGVVGVKKERVEPDEERAGVHTKFLAARFKAFFVASDVFLVEVFVFLRLPRVPLPFRLRG